MSINLINRNIASKLNIFIDVLSKLLSLVKDFMAQMLAFLTLVISYILF